MPWMIWHGITLKYYINTLIGQGQNEGNGTWYNLQNLLTINFRDNQCFLFNVCLTTVAENFQIYSVRVTGKCICEMHDLIISTQVEQPSHKSAQKHLPRHKKFFFKEKRPPYFRGTRRYILRVWSLENDTKNILNHNIYCYIGLKR